MNKLTKIGLSAMVAFSMMFATTVVVAQEKVVVSDNVEVMESIGMKPLASLKDATNNGNFRENTTVKKVLNATYFTFTGNPGEEDDINEWTETSDGTGCVGSDRACKIKVKADYLMEVNGAILIDPAQLPEIDVVPGASSSYNVPDPAQAGTGTSQPFEEIHNRSEEHTSELPSLMRN